MESATLQSKKLTIDEALQDLLQTYRSLTEDLGTDNEGMLPGLFDLLTEEQKERVKLRCFLHTEYLAMRHNLIRTWPNKIELLTHPNRRIRSAYEDILKHGG